MQVETWRTADRSRFSQVRSTYLIGVVLSLFGFTTGCSGPDAEWTENGRVRGVIVPAKYASVISDPCRAADSLKAQAHWTPTRELVLEAERQLSPALASAFREKTNLNPDEYLRQYAGVVADGKRWIRIAGVHNEVVDGIVEDFRRESLFYRLRTRSPATASYWRTSGVSLCDAGMMAFSATYSLERDSLVHLGFSANLALPQRE